MNLTALQHSAFLQSLGWAIANSLWQSALLWVVYWFVNASYKNATSKFRNLLSTTLLFSIFLWFTQTFLLRFFLLQEKINLKNIAGENIFNYPTSVIHGWKILLNNALNNLPYLSVAYLLMLVIFSARLISSYRNINFIKNNGLQKPPVEWRLFTDKVALHIGIHKKIKLWFSEHVDVPATLGFIKPVILIPLATVNQLSPDQLEAIILHELSHIQRNDYVINLLVSIIETILFFNPFVVLLSKIIKRERENCCDDFVIQYKYDPHSYASALLSIEQSRFSNIRLALTATSGKKQLLLRIKRIMENNSPTTNFNYGQKLLALILVTGIIASVAWLAPQKKETPIVTGKQSGSVLSIPMRELKSKNKAPDNQQPVKISLPKNKKNQQPSGMINSVNQENEVVIPFTGGKESWVSDNENKTELNQEEGDKNIFSEAYESSLLPSVPPIANNYKNAPFPSNKNARIFKEIAKKIDLKKIQAEFNKAKFSFSFDLNNWQKEIRQGFQKIHFEDLILPGNQKLSGDEIKRLVQNEMKNIRSGTSRVRVPVSAAHTNAVYQKVNKKLFGLIDTITSLSLAVLDKSDQNYFKRLPEDGNFKSRSSKDYENNIISQDRIFKEIENLRDDKPLVRRLPKNRVYNYRYECKEGTIILNDKKIKAQEETNTPPSHKSKKTITIKSEGNKIILIQIEN